MKAIYNFANMMLLLGYFAARGPDLQIQGRLYRTPSPLPGAPSYLLPSRYPRYAVPELPRHAVPTTYSS